MTDGRRRAHPEQRRSHRPRPSTRVGCRAARQPAATDRRRAPRAPCDRTGTTPTRQRRCAPTVPGRRPASQLCEFSGVRRTRSPHRREVLLLVEDEASVVDVAVEVDCQLRNATDRLVDNDIDGRAVVQLDSAGDSQIPIEPRVDQRPAVDLDAQLLPTNATRIGARLDAQPGRVGVGADEPQR